MSKSIVKVDAGICGFSAKITADSQDGEIANIVFETNCPNFKKYEKSLTEIDSFDACLGHPCDSYVYELVNESCPHAACPIPSGIIRAVEVACNLALPKDSHIEVEKVD